MIRLLAVICAGILLSPDAVAQRWGGGVDDDRIHFGFLFQYVQSDYKVRLKQDWQESQREYLEGTSQYAQVGSLTKVYSPFAPGWGLGLLADARVNEHVNLRFTPTLLFNQRRIVQKFSIYDAPRSSDRDANSLVGDATFLQMPIFDFPMTLRFASDRKTDYKVFIMGGGKYSFEIIPPKEDLMQQGFDRKLKTKRNYFSFEAGLGVELYLEYFKMTPEIKFSQSLHNMLGETIFGAKNNPYHSPIDKMFLRSIQFSLFFE